MTARTVDMLHPRTRALIQPMPNGCWEWRGSRNRYGHGQSYGTTAHKRVYVRLVGPVPDGLELDHLCRNPPCVNPDHLEPVTHAENMRRSKSATKTHCNYGHEFTPENTYRNPTHGGRSCRRCTYLRNKAREESGDRPGVLRGERLWSAKLTEEKVLMVHALKATGLYEREIAAQMGVSRSAIANVLQGKTWTHVQPTTAVA